jgi:16S rRNA processing protein RimM
MRLVVGLVRGVHGLNGALRVETLTDRPEARFARGAVLHREGDAGPLTIVDALAIPDGPGWRVRFREVPDRQTADTLRGVYLETDVPAADAPGRGAAYWHEVIGVPVRGLDGEELGSVADIYRVGEIDAYVVRGGPRGEFDVPAVRDFVRIFAPKRGEIVVDVAALELGPPKPPKPPRKPRPRKGEARAKPASDSAAADSAAADPTGADPTAEAALTQPAERPPDAAAGASDGPTPADPKRPRRSGRTRS